MNADGVIDMSDLMTVSSAFGQSGENLSADVNNDGEVNIVDLVIVAMHFGETTGSGAPSTPRSPIAQRNMGMGQANQQIAHCLIRLSESEESIFLARSGNE